MQKLQQNLNYNFKNINLLTQALTHSSHTSNIHCNYERLEFLGDRILGLTVADMLCQTFKNEPEGSLSQRFTRLVCKETVAEIAQKLEIENYIISPNPEIKNSINVLCDVGEAIIAAIYIDSKNLKNAQDFIRTNWLPLLDVKSAPQKDYKTLLQEEALKQKLNLPTYEMLEKMGPEHEPEFIIEVIVNNKKAKGLGKNKKQAEQNAAEKMLKILGAKNV